MKVAMLADDPGYIGGAELTMQELAAAVPDDVRLVPVEEAETVIVGNCWLLPSQDLRGKRVIRFIHDCRGPGPIDSDERIFYSPLHRTTVGLDGELCPAPIDLEPFRTNGKARSGAVHIGTFGHPGKGQILLKEWSDRNGELALYGHGLFIPEGPKLHFVRELEPDEVPGVLAGYETFVHLPTEPEAYGRGVVEAWAAGLRLVINANVGALYWINAEPKALENPAERFWSMVLK